MDIKENLYWRRFPRLLCFLAGEHPTDACLAAVFNLVDVGTCRAMCYEGGKGGVRQMGSGCVQF